MAERMTRKDVIDNAEAHILKQGRFAFKLSKGSSQPTCLYNSPSGTKCAIGGLPGVAEAIKGIMHHNKTAAYLFENCPAFAALFASDVDAYFLNAVQRRLHDEFINVYPLRPKRTINRAAIRKAAHDLRTQYVPSLSVTCST